MSRAGRAAVALTSTVLAAGAISGCAGSQPLPPEPPLTAKSSAPEFKRHAAMRWVRRQVALGPRPAGSQPSRRLAAQLRAALPHGRYQPVPGGLRNVIGTVPGRDPKRFVVVGAHYDTKDLPGFVGAIDGASGTAVVVQLAHTIKPRQLKPTVVFALFDGEESPRGTPDTEEAFRRTGIRGSKVAARAYRKAEAMILLDFVGNRGLVYKREALSDKDLWARMRAAARRADLARAFPASRTFAISDDHLPFLQQGVPAIDLIDFDYPCWHERCDDLRQVSQDSLGTTGESVLELLLTL